MICSSKCDASFLDALKLHSTTSKTCKGNEVLPEEKSTSGTPCLNIDAKLVKARRGGSKFLFMVSTTFEKPDCRTFKDI